MKAKLPSMRRVAVIGVGMSPFIKQTQRTLAELGVEACHAAIKDSGISPKDVGVLYCANVHTDAGFLHQDCLGEDIASRVGVANCEITNVENACSGGSTAVRRTWYDIGMGMYDVGIALGVDSMTRAIKKGTLLSRGLDDIDASLGMTMPTFAALVMRRHMAQYGSTPEQFAKVSVKNHRNGALNPYAQYQKEFTVEEVLNSRMVCDPLTLYMICPYSDGAAAIVLCAADKVAQYTTHPVWMAGSSLKSADYFQNEKNLVASGMGERASAEAYEMAGLGPKDLDLVELHDAFASTEIANIEDLGLCPRGEGGILTQEGATEIGGRIPVNPSGGLLAQGHPLSASGVRQICEITWHLRGQAGKRQVQGAKVGLAHMEGGMVAGLQSGVCGINIVTL